MTITWVPRFWTDNTFTYDGIGAKMGKSANGAVWLNEDKLSNYEFWQYWRNTEDADVGRFLRLFTELPLGDIAELEALEGAAINTLGKAC